MLGEGDLSHDEAPAKLSTGTGDSTTSAGAFRSQPGQAAAVTYYTPHLPAPTTTQIPTTNPTYIIQLKIYTPLTVSIDCQPAGGVQDHRKLSGLGPCLGCHGVLSGEAETA